MFAWMRGPRRGDWSVSLRSYVTAAMLVVLLPLLGHAVLVTWYSYSASRHWAERDLLGDAEHLAEDVDSRLDVARAVMQVISVSPAARRGDVGAVGELLESARASGLIRAAAVVDAQGAVLMASGFRAGAAEAIAPGGSPEHVLAGRVEGEPVLTGSLPIRSADPRLARLEFAMSVSVLRAMRGGSGDWPWHVTVVTDQRGEMVWSAQSTMGPALLRQIHDPAVTAGVVHDWAAPDGALHTIGYARAPRSGLTVVVAQPTPGLYARVPFGPAGAVAIAIGVTLLSVAMARLGAVQLSAAYQAAIRGTRAGPVRIEEAVRLGAELRSRRDRLFQAAGGIAVVELTRPPGRGWEEAEIVGSDNLRALAELEQGDALTVERLTRNLLPEDRAALLATLAATDAQASVFTRLVCSQREGEAPRYFNLVGMLHEGGPDEGAQLMLTLQDVTVQRRAELEVQAQASRLKLATEIAGLGVWERDPVRGTGHASERLWEIMGLPPRGGLDLDTFFISVHPDDRARVAQAFRVRLPQETGVPGAVATQLRYRILRPDGGVRHVRSSRVFVEDAAGRDTRVVGVLIDETEAVMAQRALTASEARFRLAVDVAELGVFERYSDPHRNVGVWNERMWRIRGLAPRAEPMGYDELVAMVHPDDRGRIVDEMRNRRRHNEGTSDYEFRLIRPDGAVRIIQSRSVRTYHEEDQAVSIVAINLDVTERRQAERALAESEARLRLAVETAELGVAELNMGTGAGVWNDRQFRICGLEPGTPRPGMEQLLALVHPEDRAMFQAEATALRDAADGYSTRFHARIIRPDGAERVLHVHSVTVRPAGGAATLLSVTQDVTERRQAEQDLADSELRFRLAVETAELGVADRNLATGEVTWTAQMCRIMGVEPGTHPLSADHTLAIVHPEDRGFVADVWAGCALAEDGFISEYDYRLQRPDGQERILHARSITLRDARGRVRLLSVKQDVTERRGAERALAASELRLRLATEATGVGIWDHDPLTGNTVWTDEMFRLRGLAVQDSSPPREFLLDLVVEQDRPQLHEAWERLKAGEPEVGYDYRVVWPDGSVRCLHAEGRSLCDADGRVIRLVGMVMDVTAQREAELVLLDRKTTLELAIEAADLGIWTREPDDTTREASARLWAMLGHPGREGAMTRDELLACLHPDDRAGMLHDWVPPEGVPAVRQREFRALWPDGTVHHFQGRRAVLRDAAGHTLRVIGLVADVTEARRSAAALAASETRLRLAVEAAELGVFDYDPKTREGEWSETTWRMRGWEPRAGLPSMAEIVGSVHPDDREASAAAMQLQFNAPAGTRIDNEFRLIRPDGTVRHLMLRAVLHRGENGRARVFGINMDVTERRTAALALEASEARLRLAVDTAEIGFFEHDPATRTSYWSDRIWQMRGLEPRETAPTFEEGIAMVHPEDRERVVALIGTLATLHDGGVGAIDYRVVRPDGSVRHLITRTITLRSGDGTRLRFHGINLDVTEMRRAAAALEESEARLRLASEAAALGVFQVNLPEGTGYWSDRMWRLRGLEPRPGLPGSEMAVAMVHPEDRAIVRGLRFAAATWPSGEAVRQQYRVMWPDGTLHHVASYAVALHGREAGAFSLIGVNLDITEQVEREQELRETAARFELAIDAAELAVWDWDPATGQMTWSPRIWQMLGSAPRETPPTPEERLLVLHPDDHDRVPTAWIRSIGAGAEGLGKGEFRVVRPDGSIRYAHWQGVPLRDAQGQIVRFAGVVADVTEARMAELALRTSEELFRMAAEAAEQGVWNHDLVTGAMTWSARLWRIHGLPPQEGAPTREDRIAFIHPEDRAEVLALADELRAAAPNSVMRRSFRILRADGAVRMVDRQAMMVNGPDGRPARIVGVVHDVTEARELAAQTMVADKLATLGEMAGAIAHELAQPLQAVMATAATARMRLTQGVDGATVEKVSDRLAWIEKQTARAGKTIQHLLAFSRGESSEGLCRLTDALDGAMELAGHGLRRDGVEVSMQVPAELPPVRGGQVEIEQVLVNLLNNARDAMAESPARRIRIEVRRDGDLVILDVADTGSGVPADKLERIFEPFFTTKPVGRGTGIGLSVARRTMQALGGGIAVANTGTGARFTLTFRDATAGA